MVEAAVDLGAVERFSALNDHAVVRAFQGNTHRGEFVYHDIKTVRFFDFQLLRIPDHGCTVRCGGKNRDDRDFIDQGRDQFALDDSAGKRRRIAHEKVCNRFSAGVLLIQKCDVSTHGAADAEHTVAGRVDADIFQEHLRAWNYQRGGDEVGGGGNISRHTDEISMEIRVRKNRCGQPFGGNVGAEEFQHQLRMVSGKSRFGNACFSVSIQSGKQDTRFDLCGCDRRKIGDGVERMAVDRKRRAAVFRNTADGSAHLGQRIDDASHRPFLNGSVTGQCTGKVLAGKNAGDQACRCSGSLQKFLQEENRKKGQLEEVQRQCKTLKQQEQEKQNAYEQVRREQLFEKEEDFKKACMKPAELERRQKAIDAYEEELRRSCQEVEWLRSQLKEKEAPDLEQTEKELKEQKEQQRLKERELRKLYSRRETNQQANRRLQQLTKEREELRKRYQVLNTLSRTANGSLTGTAKIDLESYMQRQYFQHMIRCANRHLERMAAGQFLLKCRSMENLSTQGNTGLDLDVYSLITGKVRDVKTLSGGESFMAALALALGMTDVITQAVGAVHIDTLFIDEGFGSLDENAREQAIRILQGLSGGSRLVGIISHVTELKEQIEQKLVVTKGKSGSKVEWK